MFKNKKKLKAIVLSMVLAVGTMLPVGASAQDDRPGGLFGDGGFLEKIGGFFETDGELQTREGEGDYALFTEQFGNGTDGNYKITTEQFGQQNDPDAPLGSGLLILAAAGAGYAFTKRKQNQ